MNIHSRAICSMHAVLKKQFTQKTFCHPLLTLMLLKMHDFLSSADCKVTNQTFLEKRFFKHKTMITALCIIFAELNPILVFSWIWLLIPKIVSVLLYWITLSHKVWCLNSVSTTICKMKNSCTIPNEKIKLAQTFSTSVNVLVHLNGGDRILFYLFYFF